MRCPTALRRHSHHRQRRVASAPLLPYTTAPGAAPLLPYTTAQATAPGAERQAERTPTALLSCCALRLGRRCRSRLGPFRGADRFDCRAGLRPSLAHCHDSSDEVITLRHHY